MQILCEIEFLKALGGTGTSTSRSLFNDNQLKKRKSRKISMQYATVNVVRRLAATQSLWSSFSYLLDFVLLKE